MSSTSQHHLSLGKRTRQEISPHLPRGLTRAVTTPQVATSDSKRPSSGIPYKALSPRKVGKPIFLIVIRRSPSRSGASPTSNASAGASSATPARPRWRSTSWAASPTSFISKAKTIKSGSGLPRIRIKDTNFKNLLNTWSQELKPSWTLDTIIFKP